MAGLRRIDPGAGTPGGSGAMNENHLDNLNVLAQELLPTPMDVKARYPLSDAAR